MNVVFFKYANYSRKKDRESGRERQSVRHVKLFAFSINHYGGLWTQNEDNLSPILTTVNYTKGNGREWEVPHYRKNILSTPL